MANTHTGNTQPAIDQEEHARIGGIDGRKMFVFDDSGNQITSFGGAGGSNATVVLNNGVGNIGFATVAVASAATVFAVTSSSNTGNVTLNPSPNYIGLATIDIGTNNSVAVKGNVTLTDAKTFIGLTTTTLGASPAFIGIVTTTNQPALVASAAYIGLASVNIGGTLPALSAGAAFVGLATVNIGSSNTVVLGAGAALVGIVTIANSNVRSLTGNITLSDAKTYIGLTTTTLGASTAGVGFATVALQAGAAYIGLVTATLGSMATVTLGTGLNATNDIVGTKNQGTSKTIIPKTIAFAVPSIATIAVPTNTFYITKFLINSNSTVRLNIKSGATYLTGNASLGINVNPNDGWVEIGSPDSPVYNGLAGAAAIVVEKFDSGGLVSQIGGHLMYYDE